MLRTGSAIALMLLLVLGSLPAASAEFPDYTDDVLSWRVENDSPGPSGTQGDLACQLVSADPTSEDGPCTILAFEIGNTDTHVFFRWVMDSLEFGPLAETAILEFYGHFGGTAEEGLFDFRGRLTSSSDVPESVLAGPADWELDDVLWTKDEGSVVAAIPLELIGTKMAGGAVVGEHFNVTLGNEPNTRIRIVPEELGNAGWFSADKMSGITEASQKYTIKPYGSLVAPPTGPDTIIDELIGLGVERSLSFTTATSEIHLFNWSLDADAFVLRYNAEATNGTVSLRITDPAGSGVFDKDGLAGTGAQSFANVTAGDWNVELVFDEFVGTLDFSLRAPSPDDDDVTPAENGNGAGNGNETGDPPEAPEEGGIPAPGVVILLLALAAGLFGLRRRR